DGLEVLLRLRIFAREIMQPLLDATVAIARGNMQRNGLPVVLQQMEKFGPAQALAAMSNHQRQRGIGDSAPPQHDLIAARNSKTTPRILDAPDFAIGD